MRFPTARTITGVVLILAWLGLLAWQYPGEVALFLGLGIATNVVIALLLFFTDHWDRVTARWPILSKAAITVEICSSVGIWGFFLWFVFWSH
jgi:hypothetical protein